MLTLKVTTDLYLQVDENWYDPAILSGNGTLEEQICEYEKERIDKDGIETEGIIVGSCTITVIRNVSEQEIEDSGSDNQDSQESGSDRVREQ